MSCSSKDLAALSTKTGRVKILTQTLFESTKKTVCLRWRLFNCTTYLGRVVQEGLKEGNWRASDRMTNVGLCLTDTGLTANRDILTLTHKSESQLTEQFERKVLGCEPSKAGCVETLARIHMLVK
jgi:hypothetical protein